MPITRSQSRGASTRGSTHHTPTMAGTLRAIGAAVMADVSSNPRRYQNIANNVLNSGRSLFTSSSAGFSTRSLPFSRSRRLKMGAASGIYRGKFQKPRKNKATLDTKALTHGYHCTRETFGIIRDPDCAYLAHNTFSLGEIVKAMSGAILRQIFKKAGYIINNRTQNLEAGYNTGLNNVYRLRLVKQNQITGAPGADLSYDVGESQSLVNIITNFTGLRDVLIEYFRKISDEFPRSLQLLIPDNTGISPAAIWRTLVNFDLTHMVFSINVESMLKIQNRTIGATAAATVTEADTVDNQPLFGRMYQFRHGDPRMKNPVLQPSIQLNRIKEDGMSLMKASVMGVEFQSVPDPTFWANCNKSVNVRLNPGDIKTTTIYHTYRGTLTTLLKQMTLRHTLTADAALQFSGVAGKCQMFALEEKIRTNSTNQLTINYERQLKVGCTIKAVTKMAPFVTDLATQNIDAI